MSISRANRGANLEALLSWQHSIYAANGTAWAWKVATPVTMLRRGGEIRGAKPTGLATADFLGIVAPDGQGLAIEAKEEGAHRFRWARIQPQQRACLNAYADAGGIAAVVLWWTDVDERWVIPWGAATASMRQGASMPWRAGSGMRIRADGPCDYLTHLGVIG